MKIKPNGRNAPTGFRSSPECVSMRGVSGRDLNVVLMADGHGGAKALDCNTGKETRGANRRALLNEERELASGRWLAFSRTRCSTLLALCDWAIGGGRNMYNSREDIVAKKRQMKMDAALAWIGRRRPDGTDEVVELLPTQSGFAATDEYMSAIAIRARVAGGDSRYLIESGLGHARIVDLSAGTAGPYLERQETARVVMRGTPLKLAELDALLPLVKKILPQI